MTDLTPTQRAKSDLVAAYRDHAGQAVRISNSGVLLLSEYATLNGAGIAFDPADFVGDNAGLQTADLALYGAVLKKLDEFMRTDIELVLPGGSTWTGKPGVALRLFNKGLTALTAGTITP